MREHLERFGPWAVCALLAWAALPGFTTPEATKKPDKTRSAVVPTSALVQRDPEAPLPAIRDAFQADWSPYGPEFAPEFIAAERKKRDDAEAAAVRAANEAAMAKKRAETLLTAKRPAAAAEPASFTLTLESVLCADDGATARICGRNVRVGEPVPGLGVTPAPVLERADGESADVTWRGGTWTVRLDAPVVVVVRAETPPPAEPVAHEEGVR